MNAERRMRTINSMNLPHSRTTLLVLCVLLTIPSVALANVGTPLMWAGILHLFVGNAIIGLIEGGLLVAVYKTRPQHSVALMILANYVSAWVGWLWLFNLAVPRVQFNLYDFWIPFGAMVAFAYLTTLVLEWPFVAACFSGRPNLLRHSCAASLLVQTSSYVLLAGWYGMASGATLYTRMSIVPLDQISLPDGVIVYYIADEDGDVNRRNLESAQSEKVFVLNSKSEFDLLAFESPGGEIVAFRQPDGDYKPVSIGIKLPLSDLPRDEEGRVESRRQYVSPSEGQATRLGAAVDCPWSFRAGYWPIGGLSGENSRTGERIHFALETPFAAWAVRYPTILPNDCVLFQLGSRQICILEPSTRKVALVAFGRGPLAVLKSSQRQKIDASTIERIQRS